MRAKKRLKIMWLALGILILHKAKVLGATPSSGLPDDPLAEDVAAEQAEPASSEGEALPPSTPLRSKTRVVFMGISPGGIELAPQAGVLSGELEAYLRARGPLVTLDGVPARDGVSAAKYWNSCPEVEGCLQVLGARAQGSLAISGVFQQDGKRGETIAGVPGAEIWSVRFMVVDLVTSDVLPVLEVQGQGDDYSMVQEELERLVTRREKEWSRAKPGPYIPPPTQHTRIKLSDAPEVSTEPKKASWDLAVGHRGQLLFGLSAGGAYGELGQDYVSYHLKDDENVVESYSQLATSSALGGNFQLSAGYGLTPRLELILQGGVLAGPARLRYQEVSAVVYQQAQADVFGNCISDTAGVCPEEEETIVSTWAMALQGRYHLSTRERMQPFVVGGLSFMVMSDVVSQYQKLDYANLSWLELFQPIQSLGATLGPGFQLELGPHAGFYIQVPITWRFWTNRNSTYTDYSPADGGAYLQGLPEQVNTPPITAAVDVGLQIRAF